MDSLKLMSEEDIRQYFIENGGMVRNTDIVNYFRHYLSNPAIRDEARVLFKTYVNKLASVKLENGEKFLVLKRQYFLPIDGNVNPNKPPGLASSAAYPTFGSGVTNQSVPVGGGNINVPYGYTNSTNSGNVNYARRQNSQTQLYGSQFSLNSNYMDPYGSNNTLGNANFYPASHYQQPPPNNPYNSPQPPMQNINMQQQNIYGTSSDFEYGLPPVPVTNSNPVTSPRRYVSPQNSYGSSSSGGTTSRGIIPPPYRPPPPAGRFASSPSGLPHSHGISRRSSMTSVGGVPYHRTQSVPGTGVAGQASYYTSNQNLHALMDSSAPGMFQHHRSASVTGLPAAVNTFENFTGGVPPPPVPPRSRRSVERSPSAANSYSSIPSSGSHTNAGSRRGVTTRMETDRVNGDNGEQMRLDKDADAEHEKENINNLPNSDSTNLLEHDGKQSSNAQNGISSEVEQKISVKERMQKFNRIASESEIFVGGLNAKVSSSSKNRKEIATKHESGDFDTASLSSLDPKSKEWMMIAMKCDYPVLNKMAQENPQLVRRRDMNGYTALHWTAKFGNLECVKLLAGTYKAEVNLKSNGGYTPLHLAAQFQRQDVYDVLIKTYNADANMRDHSGKKPMQYLVRQDASMSMDTFKKLKEKRRNTEQQRERDSSFLRIGSLNVKVKSTRDAFGYFLGKSTSSSSIQKNWGSSDNLQENEENDKDKQMMPPPSIEAPRLGQKSSSRRRHKRTIDSQIIKESKSDSDSDTAFGFGSDWTSPVRE